MAGLVSSLSRRSQDFLVLTQEQCPSCPLPPSSSHHPPSSFNIQRQTLDNRPIFTVAHAFSEEACRKAIEVLSLHSKLFESGTIPTPDIIADSPQPAIAAALATLFSFGQSSASKKAVAIAAGVVVCGGFAYYAFCQHFRLHLSIVSFQLKLLAILFSN